MNVQKKGWSDIFPTLGKISLKIFNHWKRIAAGINIFPMFGKVSA